MLSAQADSTQSRNGATVFSQGREPLDSDTTDPSSPGGATVRSDVSVAPPGLSEGGTHSVSRGSRPWLTTVAFSRLKDGDKITPLPTLHRYCGARTEDRQNREVISAAFLSATGCRNTWHTDCVQGLTSDEVFVTSYSSFRDAVFSRYLDSLASAGLGGCPIRRSRIAKSGGRTMRHDHAHRVGTSQSPTPDKQPSGHAVAHAKKPESRLLTGRYAKRLLLQGVAFHRVLSRSVGVVEG